MTFQVSVFLENRLGRLENVTRILREAQINIRSMHLNHTANGWGILNLVVSNPALAQLRLNEEGLSAALREISVVRMADNPGGLDELLKRIVNANVNFTSAYGLGPHHNGEAYLVVDTQGLPEAREKFQEIGLALVDDAEVYGL